MSQPPEDVQNRWNTATYDHAHSFVYEYGEDVVDLLDSQPDERILDLGCGTGHLTQQIADAGATAVGLDHSAEMIESARQEYPGCEFVQGDAHEFTVDTPFDAVFSNAALHWMPDQDSVLESVVDALRPGGRFIAELGGHGNIEAIVSATHAELAARGYETPMPWYFPTVGEYATKLETHGFEVQYATLFDRPTELDGDDGLATWMEGFGDSLLAQLSDAEQQSVIEGVEDQLREEYFTDGSWTADYRRLRVVAVLKED
jgi:trans-aconitate methyltransferase